MSDAVDSRFAPPVAHVEDVATGEVTLGSRWMRLGASIIDGLISACAIWLVSMLPVFHFLVERRDDAWSNSVWRPYPMLLGFCIFLIIQGWLLVTKGQTVGKLICKLRIVRTDGSKPEAWRLLGLRYGVGVVLSMNTTVSMIYSLLDGLLVFRASRQCLHDTIADTKVISV